jgi:hypothetical protein
MVAAWIIGYAATTPGSAIRSGDCTRSARCC